MKIEELVLLKQYTYRAEKTDPAVVAEYAGLMERGVAFPPLTVAVIGKAKDKVLVGGAHRLAAAVKAKLTELKVTEVVCKAAIDAEVLAFTDNITHGLSLTAEEKRKAILELLQKPGFSKLSHAQAAKRLGVSDMSIKRYRDAIGQVSPKKAQSGHKNAAPKVSKGGEVTPAGPASPTVWTIHGAQLGGGADKVARVIADHVLEACSPKQTVTWNKNLDFLAEVAATLQALVDGSRAKS